MVATASHLYFRVSVFLTSLIWKGRNLPAYQISARYLNPRLIYYYFRFLETKVRNVGILRLVPILRLHQHRYVILHLSTKFRPNRAIHDVVMTSYLFFKMAVTASQFYFWFSWVRSSGKVEIYLRTKFRRDFSIHGRDITTSGFWKQTYALLEFYFRFRFSHLHHHRHVILHLPTKFHPNRTIRDVVMTSCLFLRWWPSYILNYLKVLQTTHDVQMTVSGRSSNFDSIGFLIVSEILPFLLWGFGFKVPFTWLYPPRRRRIKG